MLNEEDFVLLGINNEDEPDEIPKYTGGFNHPNRYTYTYTAPAHHTVAATHHGLNQFSYYGHGYQINHLNTYYTCDGIYQENWIVPLQFSRYHETQRPGGWCIGCGFQLVNPQRLYDHVAYVYAIPESGVSNYPNYFHYACKKSHHCQYSLMRYQASICLYFAHKLQWAVSSNQDRQNDQESFTYNEMIDLFVGLKLSGFLDQPLIRWVIVRQFCFILRLNGKTTEQMRSKYRLYIENNRYKRYFTDEFHETIVVDGTAPVPP
jgi:hypothetical protein